jgi:hypothetical protein
LGSSILGPIVTKALVIQRTFGMRDDIGPSSIESEVEMKFD